MIIIQYAFQSGLDKRMKMKIYINFYALFYTIPHYGSTLLFICVLTYTCKCKGCVALMYMHISIINIKFTDTNKKFICT